MNVWHVVSIGSRQRVIEAEGVGNPRSFAVLVEHDAQWTDKQTKNS